MVLLAAFAVALFRTPLAVGDGKPFARIEEAVKAAQAGDEIDVYPSAAGYKATAVMVRTPNLTFKGMGGRPLLDGDTCEYSGSGSVPRAIFQVEPDADGVTIENLELTGAHNKSYNGAGVRINQANHCTIRNCDIHGNDMGIMSGGVAGNPHAGEFQLIDHCLIHENGNFSDPGYNHNLYLGGTSVTLQFCKISHSLTGHNVKSRAHFSLVQYCEIFGSANRELDFVDAWDTERPNSNAVLLGNIIAKDPECKGNHVVINFGQENGHRNGSIYLFNNTIKTPFQSAVLLLTSPLAHAHLLNNRIENRTEAHPNLVSVDKGSLLSNVTGNANWLSSAYGITGTSLDPKNLFTTSHTPVVSAVYEDGHGKRIPASAAYGHDSKLGWVLVTSPLIGAGS